MNLKDIDLKEATDIVRRYGGDKAADHFGVPKTTFKDWCRRNKLPTRRDPSLKAGVSIKDNEVEITSEASSDISDPEKIVIDRGLDPDEWEFSGLTVNEWDSPTGDTLKQLKVQLKRKNLIDFIEPARIDGPKRKPINKKKTNSSLWFVIGDQHAPFHDEGMHESVLTLLKETKPSHATCLGDLGEFSEISRHRHNPAWKATTQQSVDASYNVLSDYVNASPNTEWTFIEGNHENRLRNLIIDYVKDLYGLKQGGNGAVTMSIEHLLRLDELGIKFIGDSNTYEYSKVKVNKNLAIVHGHIATKHSGTSALKTLEHFGHSIIQGHTHRQSQVFKTVRDIEDMPEVLTGVEAGCGCKTKKGIGYAPQSDWQQGAVMIELYENDLFKVDLMPFIKGNLLWRSECI